MKRSLIAIACMALAACSAGDVTAPVPAPEGPAAAASVAAQLDQPFTLRVGQQATIGGEGLTVRFEAVAEDSRCPTGVQCVWEGNARVQIVLSKDGKAAGMELNTTLEPRTGTYLEYEIELLSLSPYPSIQKPVIPQSQYRATFVVRRIATTA